MAKRMTFDEFQCKSESIYGKGSLIYSRVKIVNNHTPVDLECPIHGVFHVTPNAHLQGGVSCGKCKKDALKKPIYGHGINDLYIISHNGVHEPSYKLWTRMLERCYDKKIHRKKPTYKKCTVAEDWLTYSNFKRWFEDPTNGYREGYHLDKDILVKGNKVYSPETCCFVPNEINVLFQEDNITRQYPRGVSVHKDRIIVRIARGGKNKEFGGFKTIEDASEFYKSLKREYIIEVANKYWSKDLITEKVYWALINNADYYG